MTPFLVFLLLLFYFAFSGSEAQSVAKSELLSMGFEESVIDAAIAFCGSDAPLENLIERIAIIQEGEQEQVEQGQEQVEQIALSK